MGDNFARLYMGLLDLAWEIARERLLRRTGRAAESPDDAHQSAAEKREAQLELVQVFAHMGRVVNEHLAQSEEVAHGWGASFSQLADLQGISRQAVRQRYTRRQETRRQSGERRDVRLVGGPLNGRKAKVLVGEAECRYAVEVYDRHDEWNYDEPQWAAIYVRNPATNTEYQFVRIEELS